MKENIEIATYCKDCNIPITDTYNIKKKILEAKKEVFDDIEPFCKNMIWFKDMGNKHLNTKNTEKVEKQDG